VLIEPSLCFGDAEAAGRRRMADGPILDVPKLNEHEMQQLQVLLFRYLVHKSAGFSDVVTDKLVNKSQMTPALAAPLAEPMETVEPEDADAAPPPDAQKRKTGAKSAEAVAASE